MLGVSDQAGYALVDSPDDADVIVVNTCGFIDAAKEESVSTILDMGRHKEEGRCRKLVVSGCFSQRYPDELAKELPEVDHFLGSSDGLRLRDVLGGGGERVLVGHPADYLMRATDPRRLSQRSHSVFVKIAEGCNRTCSFCAIPSIRGKQRSRPVDDLVAEAEWLVSQGAVELNLISQDTVAYGRDLPGKPTLAELVQRLAEVEGIRWLRLHYLYPETLTERLLDLLADHPRVLPYVDMPLQHASPTMLRRMRRGGRTLEPVVDRIRNRLGDDAVYRTTWIVGHPGETDAEFESLLQFTRWAEFDHVGVFTYSHEEGTSSGGMTDLVDDSTVEARRAALVETQREISQRRLQRHVGTRLEVLVDGLSDQSELLLEGRWWGQAPEVDGKVYLANGTAEPGELRGALVTAAADHDLVADLEGRDGRVDAPLESPRKVSLTIAP